MSLLSEIFTWWQGNTWGTRYTLWRTAARRIGEDEFGNQYYEQTDGRGLHRKPRRIVIYKDSSEATQIPPGWHGWMHHTVDVPPTEEDYKPREWQKTHRQNMTGTSEAYRPKGSILTAESRPKATGDYQAWKPD